MSILRKSFFLFLLPAVAAVCSCSKAKIELLTQEVNSNTTYNLYDVQFVNDSTGYICGGDRWTKGILLKTSDGGQTWSGPDSVYSQCAFSCAFFSAAEGFVAGNSSYTAYTSDSAKTFSFSESDYRHINDLAFINRQHGVKVGGDGFLKGYVAYTDNGGTGWIRTDIANAMASVAVAPGGVVFAGGYGVIYRSVDSGRTFLPLDVRGDFFLSADFPTSKVGYFAGYERMILKTTDGGNSFTTVLKGNQAFSTRHHFRCIKFWDENIGYAVGDNGIVYRTISGGSAWQIAEQFTEVNLRSIQLFSSSSGIIVGDNGKIFLFQE